VWLAFEIPLYIRLMVLSMRAFRERMLDYRGRVVEVIPYFYHNRPLSNGNKW
jgi:hypothetical protein